MQADKGRLIIHTGAGPKGIAGEATGKNARRGWQAMKARSVSRVRAGKVVVWSAEAPGEAAETDIGARKADENARKGGRLFGARLAGKAPLAAEKDAAAFSLSPMGEDASLSSARKSARAEKASCCRAGAVSVFGQGDDPARENAQAAASESGGGAAAARRRARTTKRGGRRRAAKRRMTFGERLLRNSAIACAFLLALLAARNIDTPWTRAAVEGVERALTMRIELDESLGSLSFVRDLMPESMLVFFDLSTQSELAKPVEGTLEKGFSDDQPWVEFSCEPEAAVSAAEAGTVVATTQLSGGGWGVMIEHDNGLESVSAYLLEPSVQAGERVERGQAVARSEAGRVYFEVRRDGEIIDPAPLMGL